VTNVTQKANILRKIPQLGLKTGKHPVGLAGKICKIYQGLLRIQNRLPSNPQLYETAKVVSKGLKMYFLRVL
jgi:hypothetical protein